MRTAMVNDQSRMQPSGAQSSESVQALGRCGRAPGVQVEVEAEVPLRIAQRAACPMLLHDSRHPAHATAALACLLTLQRSTVLTSER